MADQLLILLPLLTGVIGSYLTYYFTAKSKRSEAIQKFKEEKYSKLLILLQGFVGNTATGDMKRSFFEEQYQSWLYCSDEVVEAINELVKLVIESRGQQPDPEEGRKAVGNVVLAMRKDLLGKTSLSWSSFRYTDIIKS